MVKWILEKIDKLDCKARFNEINALEANKRHERIKEQICNSNFKYAMQQINATIKNGYESAGVPVSRCTDYQLKDLERRLADLGYRTSYKIDTAGKKYIMNIDWK